MSLWRVGWLAWFCCWFPGSVGGVTFVESFESDPAGRGWQHWGDPSLFIWEPSSEALVATWDSSRPNSYFAWPLHQVLTREDDFQVSLDLRPSSIQGGNDPEMPGPFEMAFGFLNLSDALSGGFVRGNGTDSPNLVEWNYFPDTGLRATIASALVATNGHFESAFTLDLELEVGALYHIELIYSAKSHTLRILMSRNGVSVEGIRELVMSPRFGDFRVNAFAVSSYSGVGQDPVYPGSIFAQAQIDNIVLQLPERSNLRLQGNWQAGIWSVNFQGAVGWKYQLERSRELRGWEPVGLPLEGRDASLILQDLQPNLGGGFYRITAARPPF